MLTVGIVGAGPAGLSAARLLEETGRVRAIVFEKQERVGGKSFSTPRFGEVHDIGTCYSTLAHTTTNRWMRELRIPQTPIARQMVDGAPVMRYIMGGRPFTTAREAGRFVSAWKRQMRAFDETPDDADAREAAAMPVGAWLDREGLPSMRRYMQRGLTNMGYGYLDETPTAQALRWCSPSLLISGALRQVKAPEKGWQAFWEKLSQSLDVRLGQPVTAIRRGNEKIDIETPAGGERVDALVIAAPLDEIADALPLSAAEERVVNAVSWDRLAATLAAIVGWRRNDDIVIYEDSLLPGAAPGVLLSSRIAAPAPKKKDGDAPRPFMCFQYAGRLNEAQLAAKLRHEVQQRGGYLHHISMQKVWKFAPRYSADALRDGLIGQMRAMQGDQRTWYTGATFSFEAVSNIVEFNRTLVPQMMDVLEP
jgi:phytoene dehydrogenase-like protein